MKDGINKDYHDAIVQSEHIHHQRPFPHGTTRQKSSATFRKGENPLCEETTLEYSQLLVEREKESLFRKI